MRITTEDLKERLHLLEQIKELKEELPAKEEIFELLDGLERVMEILEDIKYYEYPDEKLKKCGRAAMD